MNGKFPASAWWPEYFHTAFPAGYQASQGWLKSKAAYSNSMFFPIAEAGILITVGLVAARILVAIPAFKRFR